ncbi:Dmbt1 [Symbiodinium natans]|uniref:Dmbt1 protein n=1 Tax=Symbiodinium natans TaxID=878477 RepID=A0A812QID6_9DINO|nr:Dmbt1 [Symbiodinium natans]
MLTCVLGGDGCISSSGYPSSNYPDNDACTISVDSGNTRLIEVVAFSTENGYDKLWVNGIAYDGTSTSDGPAGIVPTQDIVWDSDGSTTKSGWKICLAEDPGWSVASGTCVLGGDGCISSSGYPSSNYPDNDACTISIDSGNTRLIDVVAFSTENNYDKLWVNGIAYDGTSTSDGPAGIVPTQDIVWDSDGSTTKSGWKICLAEDPGWSVASGTCVLGGDGCISSSGYPSSNYPDNDACTISIDSGNTRLIDVVAFSTENNYDKLWVNGIAYDGTSTSDGPAGIVPTQDIVWDSDGSTTKSGWKICLVEVATSSTATTTATWMSTTTLTTLTPTTTATLAEDPGWSVASGTCVLGGDGCISSSGYPSSNYPDNDACTISVDSSNTRLIDVVAFSTENNYDKLWVNGIAYDGTSTSDGPAGIVPTQDIVWDSDGSTTKSGWKICLAEDPGWSVASGTCVLGGDGCISSSGYPSSNYPDNDACTISVDSSNTRLIDVVAFSTENNYDKLWVNGIAYDGTSTSDGPAGIVPTQDIVWDSDGSTTKSGWKICLVEVATSSTATTTATWMSTTTLTTLTPTTTATLAEDPGWSVASGTCVLGGDGCISSSGYPSSNYPDNDACTISVDSSNTRLIDVVAFSTENNYDKLWVNGIAYDGTSTSDGPAGIVPTQDIVWDSDGSTAKSGWKICLAEARFRGPVHSLSLRGPRMERREWARTCVLGGDGCISSSGYPSSNYPDNDACTISIDSGNTRLIDVVAFSTENNYDKLWVNGIAYDGTSTRRIDHKIWLENLLGGGCYKQHGDNDGDVDVDDDTDDTDADNYGDCCRGVRDDDKHIDGNPKSHHHADRAGTRDPDSRPCEMDEQGCISSPNYPRDYDDSYCEIWVEQDNTRAINVIFFDTRSNHYLVVNGEDYSGSDGPQGIVPTGAIEWEVEGSRFDRGWKICLEAPAIQATSTLTATRRLTTTTTTQATTQAPIPWTIDQGPCEMDEQGCISSPNYPRDYDDSYCEIWVEQDNTRAINVIFFDTRSNHYLVVNGEDYSGSDGPQGIVPTGAIEWEVEGSRFDRGWKICLEAGTKEWELLK